MSAPILTTKLYIPPARLDLVPRPHLIERLNNGLAKGCKLTLISAPAGFGKTTLLSEWVAQCGRPAAWLSLDSEDSDPARFLTYFITALQTVAPNIGTEVLAALQAPQPPSTGSILTTLINEITANSENFVFVLDDYHSIDSKPVDEALAFLLEHLPPQMHLVITTREDPQLPLSRLRARGELSEVRAANLRFTPSEAAEFLNQVMGLNLSAKDIAALENRTEGWIAGLQLAALSIQNREDALDFIRAFTGSHRYVLDYLVEEVLQHQPDAIRDFLIQTSILERFCAPLCNVVTGREDSRRMLAELERSNLFIMPLDDERQWYRYHHLFSDALQAHFMNEQPGKAASSHMRACEWLEKNSHRSDAIHHALAAQDFTRAAELIELAIPEMRRRKQSTTILGWLKALPENLVYYRPVLSATYAWASFGAGDFRVIEARLQDAERWLDTTTDMHDPSKSQPSGMVVVDKEEFRRLPGLIAIVRAGQALAENDMPKILKNAQKAFDFAFEGDYLTRGGAASQLGLAAWANGDLTTAHEMTTEGIKNLRRGGYLSAVIGCAITLADIQITQGRLNVAKATYEQALGWATAPDAPYQWGAADMYVGLSAIEREHNDLKTAEQHLLTSQSLGELAGLPQNPYRWCAAMACIREARGDLQAALDLLVRAESLYDGNLSPNVRPVASRMVRLWIKQGRLDEAMRWVWDQGLTIEDEPDYMCEFDHITLARLLLAHCQGNRPEDSSAAAMALLERLLKAAKAGGRMGSVIEILVLQTIGYFTQGDLPTALEQLQKALALAEPEGYVRIFIDEGQPMAQLLREAAARRIMPVYTQKLLSAYKNEKPGGEPRSESGSTDRMAEPMSARELEILRLIAQGLSNRQIGQRLFLALNTIKGHNRVIFDKLQVQRRTEAVARAKEIGLL